MSLVSTVVDRIRGLTTATDRQQTVAIACQGGGSHAAFTAGVLGRLLTDLPDRYRLVGLSGASGGAVSATAAWYGLAAADRTPEGVLRDVWNEVAASAGWELWVNELALMKARHSGSAMSGGSPYGNPGSRWGRQQLEAALTEHIDFDAFETLATDAATPALLVSAIEVLSGELTVFRDGDISVDALIASAAVPQLFRAVEIDDGHYWDGFLSQNPPLIEFLLDESLPPVDELWIVQLSPQTTATLPRTEDAIDERTQQIVENLSLTHERRFIETLSEWEAAGKLSGTGLTDTTVRTVELQREQADRSRLNRRSSFISDLYEDGNAEAYNFLSDLPDAD